MQADHLFMAVGGAGNFIYVDIARIGGQNRIGLEHFVELCKHTAFDIETLKNRLDHHIDLGQIGKFC